MLSAIESLDAPAARTAFDSLSGGESWLENLALLSNDLFLSNLHDQGQLWRWNGSTPAAPTSRTWGTLLGSEPHFKGDAALGLASQNDTLWGAATVHCRCRSVRLAARCAAFILAPMRS